MLKRVMPLVTFSNVLLLSATLRILLIIYSEWHDARSTVKYTDVDYRVFSDAAKFLLNPTPGGEAKGLYGAFTGFGKSVHLIQYC